MAAKEKSTAEEFLAAREKVEKEIKDIDAQVISLNKRKAELTEILNRK